MKKIFFVMLSFLFLSPPLQTARADGIFNEQASFLLAKTVKLGRGSAAMTAPISSLDSTTENKLAVQCDANCKTCNNSNGSCSACVSGRYLSGDLCLNCPEKSYCDGKTATPNCTGVSCLSGSFAEATGTGCCCTSNCSGVVCKSGYTAKASSSGCCCS